MPTKTTRAETVAEPPAELGERERLFVEYYKTTGHGRSLMDGVTDPQD
jgi:hypothetical protein